MKMLSEWNYIFAINSSEHIWLLLGNFNFPFPWYLQRIIRVFTNWRNNTNIVTYMVLFHFSLLTTRLLTYLPPASRTRYRLPSAKLDNLAVPSTSSTFWTCRYLQNKLAASGSSAKERQFEEIPACVYIMKSN